MKESLLVKYAPSNFNEFKLLESTKILLKTYITIDSLNILLVGNSGSGKSTLIKIIINEYYNNLPFKSIENNILIINSLKEQGIAYYRNEVKTFCQIKSSIPNKKKILILDDIDIINDQSQQVFRNCIDKYNDNVQFIASCINPNKVIDSLQSRMNIIKLNTLEYNELENLFKNIIEKEKIIIQDEAIKFVIYISNNSIRTLVNYIEKFKLLKKPITFNIAQELCTNILFTNFEEYITLCKDNNLYNSIKILFLIYNKGYSVMDILDNFYMFIKYTNLISEEKKYEIIKVICTYISIFYIVHEEEIELSLFTNNIISILNSNESNI